VIAWHFPVRGTPHVVTDVIDPVVSESIRLRYRWRESVERLCLSAGDDGNWLRRYLLPSSGPRSIAVDPGIDTWIRSVTGIDPRAPRLGSRKCQWVMHGDRSWTAITTSSRRPRLVRHTTPDRRPDAFTLVRVVPFRKEPWTAPSTIVINVLTPDMSVPANNHYGPYVDKNSFIVRGARAADMERLSEEDSREVAWILCPDDLPPEEAALAGGRHSFVISTTGTCSLWYATRSAVGLPVPPDMSSRHPLDRKNALLGELFRHREILNGVLEAVRRILDGDGT